MCFVSKIALGSIADCLMRQMSAPESTKAFVYCFFVFDMHRGRNSRGESEEDGFTVLETARPNHPVVGPEYSRFLSYPNGYCSRCYDLRLFLCFVEYTENYFG